MKRIYNFILIVPIFFILTGCFNDNGELDMVGATVVDVLLSPDIGYDGTYKGTVTSNCEETTVATVEIEGSNLTGFTTNGYDIEGYTVSVNGTIYGTSNNGVTWNGNVDGEGNSLYGVMVGTWKDKDGCYGKFNLSL